MDEATNYIRVDEDGYEVHVYDCVGEVSNAFEGGDEPSRRAAAEKFAAAEAKRLGCDWGTNYD